MFTVSLVCVLAIATVLKHVLTVVDFDAKAWGGLIAPLVKTLRENRSISRAESDDMRRQILTLDRRVRALLYRDDCYFAYMRYDAEWHRRDELNAIASGRQVEPHVSFLAFRDRWMRDQGLDKESEIWL